MQLYCSFFFTSRRRHTSWPRDWSSDVCSSDLSSPSMWTRPAVGSTIRLTIRIKGGLPEPEEPTSTTDSWEAISVQIGRASCRERGEGGGGSLCSEDSRGGGRTRQNGGRGSSI